MENKEIKGVYKGSDILMWVKLCRDVMFYAIVEGHPGDSFQLGVVYKNLVVWRDHLTCKAHKMSDIALFTALSPDSRVWHIYNPQ